MAMMVGAQIGKIFVASQGYSQITAGRDTFPRENPTRKAVFAGQAVAFG